VDAARAEGTGPTPRGECSGIYDSTHDRLVVFGGYDPTSAVNDVWAFSFASGTWTQVNAAGTPPPVTVAHSAIYDASRDRMVVFGGLRDAAAFTGDVWTLSLGATPTWTMLSPAGTAPSPRYDHTAIYDARATG